MQMFLFWVLSTTLYSIGVIVAQAFFDQFGLLRWYSTVDFRVGYRASRRRERQAWIKSQTIVGGIFLLLVWFVWDPKHFLLWAGRTEVIVWVGEVLASVVIFQIIAWLIARRLSGASAWRKSYCRYTQE